MSKKPLNEKLRMILLEGPKMFGTYKYPDALGSFEEQMTGEEHDDAKAFLDWIVGQKLTYGHGNLDALWGAWQMEVKP